MNWYQTYFKEYGCMIGSHKKVGSKNMRKLLQLRIVIIMGSILLCFNLFACQTARIPTQTDEGSKSPTTEAVVATRYTVQEQGFQTETPPPDIQDLTDISTRYSFLATLDYNKHSLRVEQSIRYTNSTGKELEELPLVVPPNLEKGVFDLSSITVDGVEFLNYEINETNLILALDDNLEVDETIQLVFRYSIHPKINGGVLGYTAKRINFSDWYPMIPPYDHVKGWICHPPSTVGEYLVYEPADFDLQLTLAGAENLILAANTQVVPLALDQYRLKSENIRNLVYSVSDRYQVLTGEVEGVALKVYVFEGDEESGQAVLNNSASALNFFGELFGEPYPHKTFTVVESDFPDGMEYDGLYYLSDFYFKNYDGTFKNYLSLLSVHETSHQWWFGLVGSDQALEPWLDESLATYSEFLFIEHFYPQLADWWWQYRVETYAPGGNVNRTIYEQTDLRTYINAVYLQGAVFLHKVRRLVGDASFFDGLRGFTTAYSHKIARWDDLMDRLVPEPSDAVNALVSEYFIAK